MKKPLGHSKDGIGYWKTRKSRIHTQAIWIASHVYCPMSATKRNTHFKDARKNNLMIALNTKTLIPNARSSYGTPQQTTSESLLAQG